MNLIVKIIKGYVDRRSVKLIVCHPFLFLIFGIVTFYVFYISHKKFGIASCRNGKENAFRHALWGCLLVKYGHYITNLKKSKSFCVRVTSLHEELFPNNYIEKQMDLHNNSVGIWYYAMHPKLSKKEYIKKLIEKMNSAKKAHTPEDIKTNELIYID